jgi:hypothetical protein
MIDFLKEYGWCIWLGISMTIADISVMDWKWWAIVIPTNILVAMYGDFIKKKTK